jgi:hypothetical protein
MIRSLLLGSTEEEDDDKDDRGNGDGVGGNRQEANIAALAPILLRRAPVRLLLFIVAGVALLRSFFSFAFLAGSTSLRLMVVAPLRLMVSPLLTKPLFLLLLFIGPLFIVHPNLLLHFASSYFSFRLERLEQDMSALPSHLGSLLFNPAALRRIGLAASLLPSLLRMVVLYWLCRSLIALVAPLSSNASNITSEQSSTGVGNMVSLLWFALSWTFLVLGLYCSGGVSSPPRDGRSRAGEKPRQMLYYWVLGLLNAFHAARISLVRFGTGTTPSPDDSLLVHLMSPSALLFLACVILLHLLAPRSFRTEQDGQDELRASSSSSAWTSHAVRRALEWAVRDALQSCTCALRADEALQLAMVQWIAEYWTTTNGSGMTTTSAGTGSGFAGNVQPEAFTSASSSTSSSVTRFTAGGEGERGRGGRGRGGGGEEQGEAATVEWTDLLPMLSLTAERMEAEFGVLQQQQQQRHQHPENDSNGAFSLPLPLCPHDEIQEPPLQLLSREGSPASFSADRQPHLPSSSASSAFTGLHRMLLHMDLDGHAQPAVCAWRRVVDEVPPSRGVALALATARRCPALLLFVGHAARTLAFSNRLPSFLLALLLLPMAVLDGLRARAWSEWLQRNIHRLVLPPHPPTTMSTDCGEKGKDGSVGDDQNVVSWLEVIDPMVLILMGESDEYVDDDPGASCSRTSCSSSFAITLPALVRVWHNVRGSVVALERGLVVATCAQTTAVALDFAQHFGTLMEGGREEVANRGWLHGVALLVWEAYLVWQELAGRQQGEGPLCYRQGRQANAAGPGHHPPRIHAAVMVARHSRTLKRNLSQLFLLLGGSGDDNQHVPLLGGIPLDAVVGILAIFIGRGWLWGRDEDGHTSSRSSSSSHASPDSRRPGGVVSTVVIEELDNEVEEGEATAANAAEVRFQEASEAKAIPSTAAGISNGGVYHLKLLDRVAALPERRAVVAASSSTLPDGDGSLEQEEEEDPPQGAAGDVLGTRGSNLPELLHILEVPCAFVARWRVSLTACSNRLASIVYSVAHSSSVSFLFHYRLAGRKEFD